MFPYVWGWQRRGKKSCLHVRTMVTFSVSLGLMQCEVEGSAAQAALPRLLDTQRRDPGTQKKLQRENKATELENLRLNLKNFALKMVTFPLVKGTIQLCSTG